MFLLNEETIAAEAEKDSLGILEIHPFKRPHLGPTYYYFTLGERHKLWNEKENTWDLRELDAGEPALVIPPNGYALIQSKERFRCSKECLGIFGQSSSLIRRGLSLRNSPFIDPYFPGDQPGYLEIGLKNEITKSVRLHLGEVIGKVGFFNVADTYPIAPPRSKSTHQDYKRRSSEAPPSEYNPPPYDDHPVDGYNDVVEFGKKRQQDDG